MNVEQRQMTMAKLPESSGTALVLGLGQTGGSFAAWLARHNRAAIFADTRSAPAGIERAKELMPDATFMTNGLPETVPGGVNEILVSPGLSMDLPVIAHAIKMGLPVRSDIDLFMDACPGTVLGITGSNGKSTVTALTEYMLNAAGARTAAGGNIGTPALDLLDIEADVFVIELSSFQLERSAELPLHAAVVLNISSDHLDHHGDMEQYAAAKARIYKRCGTAIINRDEAGLGDMVEPDTMQIGFGTGIPSPTDWGVIARDDGQWIARGTYAVMPVATLRLEGRHNLSNALASFALSDSLSGQIDLPLDGLVAGAQVFAGLPHRMQLVKAAAGIRWIDDSKATNEGAAIASITAVDGPLILIAGGDAKGGDMRMLAAELAGREVKVIALGKDRQLIEDCLAGVCETYSVGSMEEAVSEAAGLARDGDTVLLAPACSSLDMFSNFSERGDCFASAVMGLQS
jgi:UDP-N-acetylmuramoylalanine--D-glutamate ligase